MLNLDWQLRISLSWICFYSIWIFNILKINIAFPILEHKSWLTLSTNYRVRRRILVACSTLFITSIIIIILAALAPIFFIGGCVIIIVTIDFITNSTIQIPIWYRTVLAVWYFCITLHTSAITIWSILVSGLKKEKSFTLFALFTFTVW